MRKKTVAEHAADHLREQGVPAVQWGDARLLHEIAALAGMEPRGPATERAVLACLDESALFEKNFVSLGVGGRSRAVRRFVLKASN